VHKNQEPVPPISFCCKPCLLSAPAGTDSSILCVKMLTCCKIPYSNKSKSFLRLNRKPERVFGSTASAKKSGICPNFLFFNIAYLHRSWVRSPPPLSPTNLGTGGCILLILHPTQEINTPVDYMGRKVSLFGLQNLMYSLLGILLEVSGDVMLCFVL
jgi:hypothetical protein